MAVRVTFLGCGDAFGSGGRLQTSFLVRGGDEPYLVDCGATSLPAMRRFGIAPNDIAAIVLSHLHGDHFGGIPFFVLDAQFVSRRTRPFTIAGPPGTRERIPEAMETMFPGSWDRERRFELRIVELAPEQLARIGPITVTPFVVSHPSGAPPFALRLECDGRVIAFTGDTEWTEALLPAAGGADLLIAESYTYEKSVPFHLDYLTLSEHMEELAPRRVVLTHLGEDMLSRVPSLQWEAAEDGLTIEL